MGTQRLQEPSFLVLTALASGPMHGYAILKDVKTTSGGSTRLGVGTLYGALERLAEQGLVEVAAEEVVDSRLRRSYRLTRQGADVLVAEARRRQEQSVAALGRLGALGWTS
ncbi:PadR family transcriptional regulator [Quadrisphaera oryzae]|uniref:PadR family transcriptional regulator n=1 Tax=Quadrisphaera TaxID=317661 RepID=UPI0016466F94|nr:PadR family transcriptional regulator [Quadrisphaera sp. RL12-1S]MBC3761253.1 PadR family transcriptional regulator [Quadrisphaera sp. RL12-1S]